MLRTSDVTYFVDQNLNTKYMEPWANSYHLSISVVSLSVHYFSFLFLYVSIRLSTYSMYTFFMFMFILILIFFFQECSPNDLKLFLIKLHAINLDKLQSYCLIVFPSCQRQLAWALEVLEDKMTSTQKAYWVDTKKSPLKVRKLA